MLQDTISYVSVSEPAPLPRLGEVFFDVRGNSRSMRLSWYADTGVAVFSIWQAGMCTGTFRLPMADLSRMIEILERGPAPRGRSRAPVAAPQGEDRGSGSDWYYGPDEDEPARPDAAGNQASYGAEYPAEYGRPGYDAGYGRTERGPGDNGAAQHRSGDYGAPEHRSGDYGAPEHRSGDYGAPEHRSGDYGAPEHRSGDYGSVGYGQSGRGGAAERHEAGSDSTGYGVSGDYQGDYGAPDERHYGVSYGTAGPTADSDDYAAEVYPADYGRAGYAESGGTPGGYESAGYDSAGYGSAGYGSDGYGSDGYGSGGYGSAQADYRAGEYSGHPDDRRAGSDRGYLPGDYDDRQEFRSGAPTDGSGYREERFVAPYVGDTGQAYPNDNPAGGAGYQRDIGDAAYPADRQPVSPSDRYPDPSGPAEEYSYGAEYRHR